MCNVIHSSRMNLEDVLREGACSVRLHLNWQVVEKLGPRLPLGLGAGVR